MATESFSFSNNTTARYILLQPIGTRRSTQQPPMEKEADTPKFSTVNTLCFIWYFCLTLINYCNLLSRFSGNGSLWKENPSAEHEASRSNWSCELLIPLPIPHPVMICLLIYNRHRDVGAIPLESESCRLLVRYLEGSATPSARTKE